VLGAYLLHHPKARVVTLIPIWFFFRIVELPAWFFLLIWIGIQIVSEYLAASAHGVESSGVAYGAHIGGFLAGMVLIIFFESPRSRHR